MFQKMRWWKRVLYVIPYAGTVLEYRRRKVLEVMLAQVLEASARRQVVEVVGTCRRDCK
jgi:hypothetical protein